MTDPQETTANVESMSHSAGESDEIGRRNDNGSDVGGPAQATESSAESALTDTSTVGQDDDPDDQSRNPL